MIVSLFKKVLFFVFASYSYVVFAQCHVSVPDTFLCHYGDSINLFPSVSGSSITSSYRVEEIPFNFQSLMNHTYLNLLDDDVSEAIDIGFEFNFYGNKYSEVYISSNGWISFSPNQSINYISNSLPSDDFSTPINAVFAAWEDWDPELGGTISYESVNSDTGKYFVVSFENVSHYVCNNDSLIVGNFQIILLEDFSIITNILDKPSCGNVNSVQGIQNQLGDVAKTVENRNSTSWSAFESSVIYIPSNVINYNWLQNDAVISEQDTLSAVFYTNQNLSLYYWDDLGCSFEVDFSISVLPEMDITIDRIDDVLYCSVVNDSFTYQWFFNGSPIPGELNSSLVLGGQGNYHVQILNGENGCYYNSRSHLYVVAGLESFSINDLNIYPQPSNDHFSIDFPLSIDFLKIYDFKGVLLNTIYQPLKRINIDLNTGIYFIEFHVENQRLIRKFIVSK